jgi:uncharacterized membrane-anchored protein YitT (DUF2179 family)
MSNQQPELVLRLFSIIKGVAITKLNKEKLLRFQNKAKPIIIRLLVITAGSLIMAGAYNALVIPNNLLSGGVSGLALIGKYTVGFPFYLGVLILNIPVFLIGLKEMDRKFILYSLFGTAMVIIALPLTKPYIPVPKLDLFLAAVFSGAIGGVGGGIVLKNGGSAGGTDIISMISKKKWNISVGTCSFLCNMVVVAISLFLFDPMIVLYSIVSMWVCGQVTNKVIDGFNNHKSVTIISDANEEIAVRIINEMVRGVTFLEGQGAYSGCARKVLNCVVNHYQIPLLKEIVFEIDPKAFMFITETVEVAGRGFTLPL